MRNSLYGMFFGAVLISFPWALRTKKDLESHTETLTMAGENQKKLEKAYRELAEEIRRSDALREKLLDRLEKTR